MKWSLLFLSMIALTSCQNDTPEPEQSYECALQGSYVALAEDGSTHYFSIELDTIDENRFTLSPCPIVYPLVKLTGSLAEDGTLSFTSYSCQNCPGLPSPGGTPRYYSASVDASGQCFGHEDSLVIDLKYELSGFLSDNYDGLIHAVRND